MVLNFTKSMSVEDIERIIKNEISVIPDRFNFKVGNKWYRATIEDDLGNNESPRDWDGNGTTMACWNRRYSLGDITPDVPPATYLANMLVDKMLFYRGEEYTVQEKKRIFINYAVSIGILSESDGKCILEPAVADGFKIQDCTYDEWNEDAIRDVMEYMDIQQLCEVAEKFNFVILPLYLYDHGGIAMSTSSFADPWDSGQVGIIYTTKEQYERDTGAKLGDDWRDVVTKDMICQVKTYARYLHDEVYGYTVAVYDGVSAVDSDSVDNVSGAYFDNIDSCYGFYNYDVEEDGKVVEKSAVTEALAESIHNIISEALKESIGKKEFREYICNEYSVSDNTTIAPDMLDGILKYAEDLSPDEQKDFLKLCLPSVPGNIIDDVFIEKEV